MKRKYGWKPDLPDFRDLLYHAIKPSGALPDSVDLRDLDSPIEDQGELGSCSANAHAGNVQFLQTRLKLAPILVSRLFIYYNERASEGTISEDSGAQLRDGIKSLATQGVCIESEWPYNIAKFTCKPTSGAYSDALARKITSYHRLLSLDDMLTCLADGFPFVFGIPVYESFESPEVARTGIVPMPGADEKMLGGHAVMAVGFDAINKFFLVRNSWGTSWGLGGYFKIPFPYLQMMADDLWTIRA